MRWASRPETLGVMDRIALIACLAATCALATPIYAPAGALEPPPPLRCGGRPATILGTAKADEIVGTDGNDVIVSFGGPDEIRALRGNDLLCTGKGSDTTTAGPGDDFVAAGEGFDIVFSGAGRDLVEAGDGGDFARGNEGRDELRGNQGDDGLLGGSGDDVLIGGTGAEFIDGGEGSDAIQGGANPPIPGEGLMGGPGNDSIAGGPGLDRALYFDSGQGVTVDLGKGTATGEGDDQLSEVEGITGTQFDDTLIGDDVSNGISAGPGNDVLQGFGSGTFEDGQSDFLAPGDGDDEVDGGGGHDFVSYDQGCFNGVTVDLAAGTATGMGDDTVAKVEGVFGSDCSDTMVGDDGQNAFVPLGSDDTIEGGLERDTVLFFFNLAPVTANLATGLARGDTSGADGLSGIEDMWGSAFGDLLIGNGQSNSILGWEGHDSLYGAGGDDFLDGLDGTDRVDGGNGVDTCSGELTNGCETEQIAAAHANHKTLGAWRSDHWSD